MIERRIFIVGASSGVAKIIVRGLTCGSEVICISRKKVKDIFGIEEVVVQDYTEESIKDLVNGRVRAKSTVVIFCNGVTDSELFYKLSSAEISNVMMVNCIVPLVVTRIFLSQISMDEIRFIYLSSSRAELGDPGITLYSASKAALTAAAKSLSLEYGRSNKYFFVISLGLSETGLINKISKEKISYLKNRGAVKKFVDPVDIQYAINYLLSNKSMTGSVLYCDNGYH
jgi:3-oxoacyl-[acyl-carrier protein] reductase